MADINKLKDKIKSTIYPNGKGAINASDHQAMLLDMADGMAETDTKLATLSVELGTANTPIVSTGTIADKRINDLKQTIDASGFKIHTYSVTREQYQTIDVLVPSGASQSSPHAGFYDANDEPIGTFVRTMNLRELTTLEVPDNAMTFKVSIYSFSANDLMVSGKSSDSIISTIEKINGIMQDHSQSLEEIKEVLCMETLVYSDNYANYGVLSSGKIVANSNINCRIVPVQKNEVVTTTAILKSVSYAAGFTTENLSGLSAEEVSAKGVVFDLFANDYSEQITIVAPSDGWMVFNIDKRSQTYVVSEDAVTKILGKIGDMKNLPTSAKADLVSAIGEVYNMALPAESVGNVSDLKTQDKSSIVAAINEVKSSVVLPEGTAYVGKATQVITHETNEAELGAEMLSASGWTLGSGWSGDFNNGFNHSGANNGSLVFPLANLIADALYLLEISVTNANTQGFDSYRVRLGGSQTFATYNGGGNVTNRWILKAGAEDGNLEILSTETAWSGSVTSISLKPITNELTPFVQYRDKASIPTASITSPMSSQGSIYLGSDIKGAFLAKENVGVGKDALKDVLSGFWNVGVGYQALTSLQNGSRNVAIGFISQLYNVSGHRNISLGSFSLENLVNGHNNIAIGADSQQDNVSGEHNISIGTRSGVGIQGRNNIAIGANTLAALGDNPENIAIGVNAMAKVTGSNKMQNVVIGVNAMDNTSGAIGNTAIGYSAAQKVTGNYNVFLGYNAGRSIEYGIGNIIIGKGADHGKNKSFSIIIGYNVTGVNDNEIRIGSSTQTSVVIAGKVLTFNADGSVTWTTE